MKPLFTENGDHHRKQLNTLQKSTDCEKPSPKGYIYSTAPSSMHLWLRKGHRIGGGSIKSAKIPGCLVNR